MDISPSEFFSAGLDQTLNNLNKLTVIIRDLTFSPPYDLFQQIFIHCVDIHKRWTIDLLKDHLSNPDKFEAFIKLLDVQRNETDIELILEKFYSYKLQQVTEKFVTRLTNNTVWSEQVEDTISQFSTQLTRLIRDKKSETNPINGIDLLELPRPDDSQVAVPLQLGFDDILQGGVHPGEVLLYLAPTNGGKTSVLLRQAVIAAAKGFKAYYASLEMGLDVIAQRIETVLAALHLDKSCLANLYVKQYPSKQTSIEEVFLDTDPLGINVLLLDYLDLLKVTRSQQYWLELEDLTAYFRGMLVERKMIGFSASQTNREGIKESKHAILGLESVSNSVGKVFTADYVISINPPPVEGPGSGSNITNFFLAKNRRGPKYMQSCTFDLGSLQLEPIIADYMPT